LAVSGVVDDSSIRHPAGMTATPSFIEKGTWLTEESRLWFA
jgi:hypothetical protein